MLFATISFVQMMTSLTMQKRLSFMKSHLLIVDLSAFFLCSTQKVFSCANEFKAIPHRLLYQVFCVWFHVELFDPIGVECCAV